MPKKRRPRLDLEHGLAQRFYRSNMPPILIGLQSATLRG